MAAGNDALANDCVKNPEYAVICSFFEQFGDKTGLLFPSFQDLQQMLESNEEVAYALVELHVKLLRKLKKSVSFDRWEKAASKFAQAYSPQDGWEIDQLGYRRANLSVKLRLLKNLLEAQFDGNLKFKSEVNKVASSELRLQPLGRDLQGRRYWHLLDDECNLRVYREDLDEETWELVASDKETMVKLIGQLSSGKESTEEETSPESSEDSNNTNGVEGFTKSDHNDVEQLEGPSDPKRLKTELESVNSCEPVVSEAIESPVLLVHGQGNGADCETGNPSETDKEDSHVEQSVDVNDSFVSEAADRVNPEEAKSQVERDNSTLKQTNVIEMESKIVSNFTAEDDMGSNKCISDSAKIVSEECPQSCPVINEEDKIEDAGHGNPSINSGSSCLEYNEEQCPEKQEISSENEEKEIISSSEEVKNLPRTSSDNELIDSSDSVDVQPVNSSNLNLSNMESDVGVITPVSEDKFIKPSDDILNCENTENKVNMVNDATSLEKSSGSPVGLDSEKAASTASPKSGSHSNVPGEDGNGSNLEINVLKSADHGATSPSLDNNDLLNIKSEENCSSLAIEDNSLTKSNTENCVTKIIEQKSESENSYQGGLATTIVSNENNAMNNLNSFIDSHDPTKSGFESEQNDPRTSQMMQETTVPSHTICSPKMTHIETKNFSSVEETTISDITATPLPEINNVKDPEQTTTTKTMTTVIENDVNPCSESKENPVFPSPPELDYSNASNLPSSTKECAAETEVPPDVSLLQPSNQELSFISSSDKISTEVSSVVANDEMEKSFDVVESTQIKFPSNADSFVPLVVEGDCNTSIKTPVALQITTVELTDECREEQSLNKSDPTLSSDTYAPTSETISEEAIPEEDNSTVDIPVRSTETSESLPRSDVVTTCEENPEASGSVDKNNLENIVAVTDLTPESIETKIKIEDTHEGKPIQLPRESSDGEDEQTCKPIAEPATCTTVHESTDNGKPQCKDDTVADPVTSTDNIESLIDSGKDNQIEQINPSLPDVTADDEKREMLLDNPVSNECIVNERAPNLNDKEYSSFEGGNNFRLDEAGVVEKCPAETPVVSKIETIKIVDEFNPEINLKTSDTQSVIIPLGISSSEELDLNCEHKIVESPPTNPPCIIEPNTESGIFSYKLNDDKSENKPYAACNEVRQGDNNSGMELKGNTSDDTLHDKLEANHGVEQGDVEEKLTKSIGNIEVKQQLQETPTSCEELTVTQHEVIMKSDEVPQVIQIKDQPLPVNDSHELSEELRFTENQTSFHIEKIINQESVDKVTFIQSPESSKELLSSAEQERVIERNEPSIIQQPATCKESIEGTMLSDEASFYKSNQIDCHDQTSQSIEGHKLVEPKSNCIEKVEHTLEGHSSSEARDSLSEVSVIQVQRHETSDPDQKIQSGYQVSASQVPLINSDCPALPLQPVEIKELNQILGPVQTEEPLKSVRSIESPTVAPPLQSDCVLLKETSDLSQTSELEHSEFHPTVDGEKCKNNQPSDAESLQVEGCSNSPNLVLEDLPGKSLDIVKEELKEPELEVCEDGMRNDNQLDIASESTGLTKSIQQLSFDYDPNAPIPVLPQKTVLEKAPARRGRKRTKHFEIGGDEPKDDSAIQPPVLRQSSRIAKLREKEDEERRKLEAERLQRLKEEHERREKRRLQREERKKKLEEKQQRRQQKTTKKKKNDVLQISDDDDEDEDEDEDSSSDGMKGKKPSKKESRRRKKKKLTPWDSSESSEESSESEDDVLDDLRVEEEEELIFKSDHEFSPESDLDGEAEPIQPTKHARTARADDGPKKAKKKNLEQKEQEVAEEEEEEEEDEDEEKDTNCQKCGQSDHPEWILLCDKCDAGWHASCVRPALMVVPEGDWFCPPCEHFMLLERLQERFEAHEFLLQEKEAELKRRKEQEQKSAEVTLEQVRAEAEEEEEEEEEDDDRNSELEDHLEVEGEEEEEEDTSGDSDEEEEEKEWESGSNASDNFHKRRQRKAAQQANYSFKDYDDMIKSALEDEADEGAKMGEGKEGEQKQDGEEVKVGVEKETDEGTDTQHSGKRRLSSDADSDIMPRIQRKKKARKLNDLSATSNEDDSDEDFEETSAEASESEEDDDDDITGSDSSFVVDDDSDSDVIDVRVSRKGKASSPTIRRSTRNSRKKYSEMLGSDSSEEESDSDVPSRKRRGYESWEESDASSSDASWGRSKKRQQGRGRARQRVINVSRPKPITPKKVPSRGRGRGVRSHKTDSDDEPFRSNVTIKKIKQQETHPQGEDEKESDSQQRRSTRGKQVSYKELISSGESEEEAQTKEMIAILTGRGAKRGIARRGRGRGTKPMGVEGTVPVSIACSVISRSTASHDDESRYSGSTDTLDFTTAAAAAAAAAAVYTTGEDSHASNEMLPPTIDPDMVSLPALLPHDDEPVHLTKDEIPCPIPVLPPDLQVTRLVQQRPPETSSLILPPELQINRLISSQTISSPARNSPALPTPRIISDVIESETLTPPPATQPSPHASSELPVYGGVIKQARHALPPTPPLYSGPHGKTADLGTTPPSVIRPFPTTVPSPVLSSSPVNPLSIQGLLGSAVSSSPSPLPSHSTLRAYSSSSHLISHTPYLNHPSYSSPYSMVQTRTSYIGNPVTPTPRPAYPPIYSSPHLPHCLPIHTGYPTHPSPLRPSSSYQHAGFPQAFAAAAASATGAEEERRIFRVAQAGREPSENFEAGNPLVGLKGIEDLSTGGTPQESEFGGLVSYFSSQQEDFEES